MLENSILIWVSLGTLFLAGCVKGIVGLGLPTVTLAILTILIDLPTAMVVLVIPSFITNLIQALAGGNWRNVWQRTRGFMVSATLAIAVGGWLCNSINLHLLSLLLGVLITLYAVSGLIGRGFDISSTSQRKIGPIFGAANGVLTGMTGSFVVPGVFYLKAIGLDREQLIQAMGILFTLSTVGLAFTVTGNALVNRELVLVSALSTIPALETVQKTHHPWSHSHYCPNSPTLLAFQTNTPSLQKYPIMTVINLQTLA